MRRIANLNIAHVVFSFDYGGLERRILRLIAGLASENCKFHVISLRHSDGRFLPQDGSVTHHILNAQPGADFAAVWRLAKYLREHDVHIVHSHNWVSMLEGILSGRIAKTPVVVHGEHGASRFEPAQLKWRRTITQKMLARLAHQIIPVNNAIAGRITELWGIETNRITPIQNGVDTSLYKPASPPAGEELVIGSVSRLNKIKNFPCLIRAVASLNERETKPKYRLVIVGGGEQLEELQALVTSLNATSFIEFPGATDHANTWYGKFDIYVNSSFSEGMSNTVLEAMACGLPIVATDVAGHRDWLRENEHALFFVNDNPTDLADKIAQFGENENKRREVGQTNREYVIKEYSQEQFLERYKNLYKVLLSKRSLDFDFNT